MMDLFHSLSGMVDVELTSADIPAALMIISQAGIKIFYIHEKGDLTACIQVERKDYRKLCTLCQNTGDTLRLISRKGTYWRLKALRKRPVLLLGLGFLIALVLTIPSRIFFVQVEGNDGIPSNRILEAAETCGISFGASRREVRSEKIKNTLLQELPELQWAGVNTYGCVAVISVKERSIPVEEQENPGFGNVVALREGIITSCTAIRGTLLCQTGQAVVEGQVLISGYTDCGLLIQTTCAEGEVYAHTQRKICAILPAQYAQKQEITEIRKSYGLLIGKKRINLWKDSGIWDSRCGRIYEENYITLPGDFVLPFGWSVDSYFVCATSPAVESETDAQERLAVYANDYVRSQMIAGVIESQRMTVSNESGVYRLDGEYVCTEMIGKWQAEQIGEMNGKIS